MEHIKFIIPKAINKIKTKEDEDRKKEQEKDKISAKKHPKHRGVFYKNKKLKN